MKPKGTHWYQASSTTSCKQYLILWKVNLVWVSFLKASRCLKMTRRASRTISKHEHDLDLTTDRMADHKGALGQCGSSWNPSRLQSHILTNELTWLRATLTWFCDHRLVKMKVQHLISTILRETGGGTGGEGEGGGLFQLCFFFFFNTADWRERKRVG